MTSFLEDPRSLLHWASVFELWPRFFYDTLRRFHFGALQKQICYKFKIVLLISVQARSKEGLMGGGDGLLPKRKINRGPRLECLADHRSASGPKNLKA